MNIEKRVLARFPTHDESLSRETPIQKRCSQLEMLEWVYDFERIVNHTFDEIFRKSKYFGGLTTYSNVSWQPFRDLSIVKVRDSSKLHCWLGMREDCDIVFGDFTDFRTSLIFLKNLAEALRKVSKYLMSKESVPHMVIVPVAPDARTTFWLGGGDIIMLEIGIAS